MLDQLSIGKPVIKSKNPKRCWRLHVRVMHGDADKHETVTQDFYKSPNKSKYQSSERDLELLLAMLQAFFRLSWNDACDERNVDRAIAEAAKAFPEYKYPTDLYSELIPSDCTTQCGDRARPMSVTLTYFNTEGVEHQVDVPKGLFEK